MNQNQQTYHSSRLHALEPLNRRNKRERKEKKIEKKISIRKHIFPNFTSISQLKSVEIGLLYFHHLDWRKKEKKVGTRTKSKEKKSDVPIIHKKCQLKRIYEYIIYMECARITFLIKKMTFVLPKIKYVWDIIFQHISKLILISS